MGISILLSPYTMAFNGKNIADLIHLSPPDPAFESVEYRHAMEFLRTTYPTSVIKLGLERITRLLELLGRPQDAFPSIIVAGTNGKGSTCVFIESILSEAGLMVGTNLSPHLEQPTERIRTGRRDISPIEFSDIIHGISELVEKQWGDGERPTYHELMTAAALVHFASAGVQAAILEVGLGGRYDAANAVDAPLAVLTPIGMDHMDRLGDDIASIAAEKVAVVRPGAMALSAAQEPDATAVFDNAIKKIGARMSVQHSGGGRVYYKDGAFYGELHLENKNPRDYRLGIGGACQGDNARLAIEAAMVLQRMGLPKGVDYAITDEAIEAGLRDARLPGRFEILSGKPMLVLDGAHNPHAAKCLSRTLDIINGGQWDLIWGMKSDKVPVDFLRELARYIGALHLCPVPGVVSHEITGLARIAADEGIPERAVSANQTPEGALCEALATTSGNGRILITGSLYLAGYLRGCLRKGFDCKDGAE